MECVCTAGEVHATMHKTRAADVREYGRYRSWHPEHWESAGTCRLAAARSARARRHAAPLVLPIERVCAVVVHSPTEFYQRNT